MKISTWQEWLKGAHEAWENQGNPRTNRGKEVLHYLLKVDKDINDTLMQVVAKAWKRYKKESQTEIEQ